MSEREKKRREKGSGGLGEKVYWKTDSIRYLPRLVTALAIS